MATPKTALEKIKGLLGPNGALEAPSEMAPYLTDWRGRHTGKALLIALPKTTAETAKLVRICFEAGIPMVPQGGNTGLVEGGVPGTSGKEIVVSLRRMNCILNVDPVQNTAIVEAGVVLAALQTAAEEKDRLFPLSLGAEGSCQVGGNIATNAGGIHVLRFGPMRELVLGLEAVLPDGRVWNGLSALRKDNTGYDLKQLFIGSEGTLGIITRAVLRLYPRPKTVVLAASALADPAAALALFNFLQTHFGDRLSAFEIFPKPALEMVLRHIPGTRNPFAEMPAWVALAELWDTAENPGLTQAYEQALSDASGLNLITDAVIAASEAQRHDLWKLREAIAEAQKQDGDGIKHDVSVPVGKIPEFIARADAAVERIAPGFKRIAFGHMGDGNIHYDPCPPEGAAAEAFRKLAPKVSRAVNDIVADLQGSISAEHGIGAARRAELKRYKSKTDLALFRAVKAAFDPKGLMNPGKLI
jgi:FAD/FMN-containing dehydrogenase